MNLVFIREENEAQRGRITNQVEEPGFMIQLV